MAVRIKSVLLRGLDHTEQDRTATGPAGGVGEQGILPGDHKGLVHGTTWLKHRLL